MHIRLSSSLRLLISIASLSVLGWILWQTDHAALLHSLSNISIHSILSALALVQAQIVLSALRWRFTSKRLGEDISVAKAIREYYVATLLNQTLPGGVSGDIVRAWRMRGTGSQGWKQPTKAIIFERASGQLAFFALSLVGLFVYLTTVRPPAAPGWIAFSLIGILILISFFILINRVWANSKNRHLLLREVSEVFVSRRAWIVQSCLSASVLACYIGVFWIAANATGPSLPIVAIMTIIPFCLVAMLIPSGFGGWGTREAAAMALWPLIGAAPADGLSASITYGWLSLLGATPGILLILAAIFQRKISDAVKEPSASD